MRSQQLSRIARTLAVVMALLSFAGAANAQTNFNKDVTNAIDAWLAFARANNYLSASNTAQDPFGLVVLAFLEKRPSANPGDPIVGYTGSTPADQCSLRNAISQIIDGPFNNHADRASFYAYVDGIDLLALSQYAITGGPDPNAALDACPTPFVPGATRDVRAAIDKLVDRTLASQTGGAAAAGSSAGWWGYTGPGGDSSTTQFASGGLAAAKGFYLATAMDPGGRGALIDAALSKVRSSYALNVRSPAVDFEGGNEGGWGYNVNGYAASSQQTASGLWVASLAGADVNDAAVQKGLRWQRNHYKYSTTIQFGNSWATASFGYYMFSSSKAYTLLEQGAAAIPGNVGTGDLGSLKASSAPLPAPGQDGLGREARRNPLVDGCARPAPYACVDLSPTPYTAETPRWYYDYAYNILSRQAANGSFNEIPGQGPWNTMSNQAYYELVLQRSIGGACVDNNNNQICDDQEKAAIKLNVASAPGTGTSGVSLVTVTGGGWPAGAIAPGDVSIFMSTGACMAAGPIVTTASKLTTVLGTTRRAQFLIPAGIAPGTYQVWLSGATAGGFASYNCSQLVVSGP